jgi:uncharacterized ferritin-like protein (DUF455 family)
MEIRLYAEAVLFEPDLAAKLADPGQFTDLKPGPACATPTNPGRSPHLRFRRNTGVGRVRFPRGKALETDTGRGTVLHFFANHELLALELIALMLLRFPDAPPAFRRGLAGIMRDEQKHLRFYLDRMAELGVAFGEVPLSDFFWTVLRDAPDARAFTAGMSLTLEQANLDFALQYARAFRQVGDEATGAVLDIVLRDEIRHVAHGLQWYRRWMDPKDDLWSAYVRDLAFPLTPARAKGVDFDVGVRREAGLDDAFIHRLRVYNQTKGRSPALRWFDPTVEDQVRVPNYQPSKAVLGVVADLEALPMFLGRRDDVVAVRQQPSLKWLADLQQVGFTLPEFVEADFDAPLAEDHPLATRALSAVLPWGPGPRCSAWSAALGTPAWAPERGRVYGKDWAAQFRDDSTVCRTRKEVHLAIEAIAGPTMIKAAFGTAGRQQLRLADGVLPDDKARWLDRALGTHHAVVVEPLYDRVADVSAQFVVAPDGAVRVAGITRFLTDARGTYRGTCVGSPLAGLDVELRRFFAGAGDRAASVASQLTEMAERVGAALAEAGHRGPAGLDALVARTPEGLRLIPLIEVNPRATMGHVSLGLAPRVANGCIARFVLWSRADLKRSGLPSFSALAAALAEALPQTVRLTPKPQLTQGALALTDPARATVLFAQLLVVEKGPTLNAALSRLNLPLLD